jgi:hypothetical protein
MQKRTEITIETERVVVINQRRERPILWCNHCATDVPMLSLWEAAATYNLAQAGLIHFAVTPEGGFFICPYSSFAESGVRS